MLKNLLKGFLILCAASVVIGAFVGQRTEKSSTLASTADSARDAHQTQAYATAALGERTIRSMLKDPDSGVFKESEGRIKGGMHVACGYVNAKNSFGAMAGASPWLVIIETKTAMIGTEENARKFVPLWNKYCAGPEDGKQPQHNPPDSFRGIKWGSALPSVQKLRLSALKGCPALVEQKDFTDKSPCSHMHVDADGMELFIQRQNVPPILDVPVSEQMLTWSGRKFWSGEVFIYSYKESDLTKLRTALTDQYGQPTLNDERQGITKWSWPSNKLEIRLHVDPVAKPSFGSSKPPQNSISLFIGRTE